MGDVSEDVSFFANPNRTRWIAYPAGGSSAVIGDRESAITIGDDIIYLSLRTPASGGDRREKEMTGGNRDP